MELAPARDIRRFHGRTRLSFPCGLRGRTPLEHPVGPRDKVLPIGAVRVAAIVLPPGKLSVEQADIHRRHLLFAVIVRSPQVPGAEQPEYGARGDRRHEAALMVEPLRVTLLRYSVTDEGRAGRAQRDQLVRVYRQVACG